MTIWERTAAALASLNISMGADAYISTSLPDQYMVYSLVDGAGAQFADNSEKSRTYRMQISFYSRSGLQESNLTSIIVAMTAAGFTHGPDAPLPYVESTRHFGLALDFFYLQEA